MRFVYSVIRCVPDTVRGEFVNVGVIAGNDESGKWGVRRLEDVEAAVGRLRGSPSSSTALAVIDFVDRIGTIFAGRSIDTPRSSTVLIPSEAWLKQLHVDCQNLIQLKEPAPMVAANMPGAVDRAFDLFVAVAGD